MMLSDVCLSVAYIGPKSRTEKPRKTKIGRGSQRRTFLGHHFQVKMVKGQGHHAALFTAAFTHQAAAAVAVGTYSSWEPTATVAICRRVAVGSAAPGVSAPTEGGGGWGHIVAATRLQLV